MGWMGKYLVGRASLALPSAVAEKVAGALQFAKLELHARLQTTIKLSPPRDKSRLPD
jgi:hypothetical protein